MSRKPVILLSLFAALCLAGKCPFEIKHSLGVPGSAGWAATCGPGAHAPTGPSQLSTCNPATDDCFLRTTLPAGDGQQFPNAVCSDGSPGVFYVRPGSGADADKWVVHVQGGGSCRDHESCMERWCGQQGSLPYTANKMSSDWDDDGVVDLPLYAEAGGMAADVAGNDFNDWTHVWMYYCSSDSWMGRASDVEYLDTGGAGNGFSIYQRGHTILSAARRMLRKNGANPGWTTDDGTTLPDLDDATDVVFTGTSAGGKGAIHNVDWFLTPFDDANTAFVLDANLDMTDDVLVSNDIWVDTDGSGSGDVPYYSHRISTSLDSWESGWHNAVNAFVDQSCRDTYEPIDRLDRCSYFGPLLTLKLSSVPMIETDTFVRVDLEEGVVSKMWRGPFPTGERLLVSQFGRETTGDDFTDLIRQTMEQLFDDPDNSVSGVFGPRCGQHVGLESSDAYFLHLTPDTTDDPVAGWVSTSGAQSAHEAIWSWYTDPLGVHRTLDTGDVGDPTVRNDPVADPVVQLSTGPGCAY